MSSFFASSNVMHKGLQWLTSQVGRICVCNTQPSNVAQAIGSSGNVKLCHTSSAAVGAIGSTSNGYTVKVTSAPTLAVTSSGIARCVVLVAGTSHIAYVNPCTTRAMTTTDTCTIPAYNIRLGDPSTS